MYKKFIITVLLITGLMLYSCDNKKPDTVWGPDYNFSPKPLITNIEPGDSAIAGMQLITITGQNFSPTTLFDLLTVNGKQGVIQSASQTKLEVIPPLLIGDSLTLRIDVKGSVESGMYYPYKLISPASVVGIFNADEFVQDIEVDKDNALYVLVSTPDGKRIVYKKTADNTARTEYGRVTFPFGPPSMKFGPDGSLFICRKNNKKFYRIPPGGGDTEQYVRLPGKVQSFDFGVDGNIYIGGSGNKIYRILPNKSIQTVADYDTIDIVSIRIYDNYVYVVGEYAQQTATGLNFFQKVWRNPILGSMDTLGTKEIVFDWSDYNSNAFISAITFSEDGEIFISTNANDPLTILDSDNNSTIFLEGILPAPASGLSWGQGDYFYYINKVEAPPKKQLIKVFAGKKGAQYYGRN